MNIKILLVDDEEKFTEVLSERLSSRDYNVDVVNSGFAAVDQIRKKEYDAVILDLAMPEMDGISTLKQLLITKPDLQIIFLTGHATLEKGIEAVKLGAMDFIEKPVELEKLIKKIKIAKQTGERLGEKRVDEKIQRILKKKGW